MGYGSTKGTDCFVLLEPKQVHVHDENKNAKETLWRLKDKIQQVHYEKQPGHITARNQI